MIRARRSFSITKKETHVASQPKADAIEPTSVTGTSSESPSSNPITVIIAIAPTAMYGVWYADYGKSASDPKMTFETVNASTV